MAVELTPSGTRGANIPRLRGPMKIVLAIWPMVMRRRGAKLLNLTRVGARSGNQHTIPLRWFSDGKDAWLVVASFGGAAKHPAWYVNIAKNPDKVWIELGNRKLRVQPESLKGAAREEAWRRIVAEAPGYGAYQEKTDREIPIVRLVSAPASSSDD